MKFKKPAIHQIDDSLNFINEKRRFIQPHSEEATSNGPSRPMFLVAVRPLPHPDGTVRPIQASNGNPILAFSHGNYPPATFLQESRNGKFLPQGRSAGGSVQEHIQFDSPSFSVSNPQTFNMRQFAPQTRLSRRIGHASSSPVIQSFRDERHLLPVQDSLPAASENKNHNLFDEFSAGSVHIGVVKNTPPEEILNAFIEIKKTQS